MLAKGITAAIILLVLSSSAFALSQKTFVAHNGTDAGTCPQSAPCATFAFAFGQTTDQGAIIVLDSGEYGPVTLSRSVSVVADGAVAAVAVPAGGSGVVVTSGAAVLLRGISFVGGGGGGFGAFGVDIQGAMNVTIENCVFGDLTTGVAVRSTQAVTAVVASSTFRHVGNAVLVTHSNTGVDLVTVSRATMNYVAVGVGASSTASGGLVHVQISESVLHNAIAGGINASAPAGTAPVAIVSSQNRIIGAANGVVVSGPQAKVFLDRTTITGCSQALSATFGATIISHNNNPIDDNLAIGMITIFLPLN